MVSCKKLESCGAHHNSLLKKEPFNQNCINRWMQERIFSWKGQIGIPWYVHIFKVSVNVAI
jgi:hypothetical protein